MISDVHCPKCGAYVGAADYCEVCGSKIPRPKEIKVLRILSVSVGVFGVIALIVLASIAPYQAIEIGNISPTNNYAVVKISGRVASVPYLTESSLTFVVKDSTGSVDVRIYSPMHMNLKTIPEFGDFVELVGTVYYRGDYHYIILKSPDLLWIRRPPAINTSVDSILSGDFEGVRVRVEGYIINLEKRSSWFAELENSSRIALYFPSYLVSLEKYGNFNEGDRVIVEGVVHWYGGVGGEWEIVVSEVIPL